MNLSPPLRHPEPRRRSGVALVVTLIMLSVITVVAVAFLALAMRDRSAATTADKMTRAQLMADAARDRAIAEIGAQMLEGYRAGATSLMSFDLIVSRTNEFGDLAAPVVVPAANRLATGNRPLLEADTNMTFLDLNRNGWYDTNYSAAEPGDPEWIGVSPQPLPLAENNHFEGRYAYAALPAGKSLDIDFIHNQAKQIDPANEGFTRANGLGSWELNLAAFLVDLNTNAWPVPPNPVPQYEYRPEPGIYSLGGAFWDAFSLLQFRYDTNFTRLDDAPPPLERLYGFTNNWAGADNQRHYYDVNELFNPARPYTNFTALIEWVQSDPPNGDPTNEYNRQTFYRLLSQMGTDSVPDQSGRINLNFIDAPGSNILGDYLSWTNDPTLFFNRVAGRLLQDMKDETRLEDINLFANLLTPADGIAITNWPVNQFEVPLWPVNHYTPAVHRILQLTANLYDATQEGLPSGQGPGYAQYFPTVFRPVFRKDAQGRIFLVRYQAVADHVALTNQFLTRAWHDPKAPGFTGARVPRPPGEFDDFIYGIPLLLGAKKGFPNLNELTLDTEMVITRKVELAKSAPDLPPNQTNQMYLLSIANRVGIEAWNAYATPYPNDLTLFAAFSLSTTLTNDGNRLANTITNPVPGNTNLFIPGNTWAGAVNPYMQGYFNPASFKVAAFTNLVAMPLMEYKFNGPLPFLNNSQMERVNNYPVPQWDLGVTNRLLFYIFDRRFNRLVDFVSLSGLTHTTNIMAALMQTDTAATRRLWDTNLVNGVGPSTLGIKEQIDLSTGDRSPGNAGTLWRNFGNLENREQAIERLKAFLDPSGEEAVSYPTIATQMIRSVGFTPITRLYLTSTWQANDPLVHAMEWDLVDATNHVMIEDKPHLESLDFTGGDYYNLGQVNLRYRPWYNSPSEVVGGDPYPFDLAIQDPLVRSPEDWDFTEGPMPNVGWLGRVHRGTPWQTVYLKAEAAAESEWVRQTGGAAQFGVGMGLAAGGTNITSLINAARFGWGHTYPTNDWRLVDLFTTAPNANATRGTLSVNQAGQAAWSAVLAGVEVLSNQTNNSILNPGRIRPASPELQTIVDGINAVRTSQTNGVFNRLSEFLAVPELSVDRKRPISGSIEPRRSPFLFMRHFDQGQDEMQRTTLNDAAYEYLPMQILSLLRVGEPRVVIYAYGQSLEPYGPDALDPDRPGVPINYRVNAEYATRSVVRFDLERIDTGTNTVIISLKPVIESFNILTPD